MDRMRSCIPPTLGVIFCGTLLLSVYYYAVATTLQPMTEEEQLVLRNQTMEMFLHAYNSYMKHAYPADELMPIACKGRIRGKTPSRGDLDDALGNFSLTLIDTLDTLAVLGLYDEFEDALKKVQNDVQFNSNLVVSVFETNIRVLGGLLGGHAVALELKEKQGRLKWYDNSLLRMAQDVGDRLLPAFNTTSGIPLSRINLSNATCPTHQKNRDTCTACAGTMILEMAALSRFTETLQNGKEIKELHCDVINNEMNPIYEEKARQSMDYLWSRRQRSSDLMGTVLSVDSGEWIRKESGVGAGIDSYYEYLLKAYILLGDETFLNRFNIHYEAIQQYIAQGPLMLDVLMHKPTQHAKHFIDALSAFWPGLQVMKGDINAAVESHELLYQVFNKHTFLPEAFTTTFDVHWGQYPLRPEFAESTYHLYKATKDPYYLEVGKTIVDNLQERARVRCGFAGIKDIRTFKHEDRMDSYFLAEMFKYLYLLFTPTNVSVGVNVEDYVFTTEAHLLPLKLSLMDARKKNATKPVDIESMHSFERNCPRASPALDNPQVYAEIRSTVNIGVIKVKPNTAERIDLSASNLLLNLKGARKLVAKNFIPDNDGHVALLRQMGITMTRMKDNSLQLFQNQDLASTYKDAVEGALFMQEMAQLTEERNSMSVTLMYVHVLNQPYLGDLVFVAGSAQFGPAITEKSWVKGEVVMASPENACKELMNSADQVAGKIVITRRGDCMFVEKAKSVEKAGGVGMVVIDNVHNTSYKMNDAFSMAGDGKTTTKVFSVFLFWKEGQELLELIKHHEKEDSSLTISMSNTPTADVETVKEFAEKRFSTEQKPKEGSKKESEAKAKTEL